MLPVCSFLCWDLRCLREEADVTLCPQEGKPNTCRRPLWDKVSKLQLLAQYQLLNRLQYVSSTYHLHRHLARAEELAGGWHGQGHCPHTREAQGLVLVVACRGQRQLGSQVNPDIWGHLSPVVLGVGRAKTWGSAPDKPFILWDANSESRF